MSANSSDRHDGRSIEELRALLAAAEAERDHAKAIALANERVIAAQKALLELSNNQQPPAETSDAFPGASEAKSRSSSATHPTSGRKDTPPHEPIQAQTNTTQHQQQNEFEEPNYRIKEPNLIATSTAPSMAFDLLKNPMIFFLLYLLFVIPTYILPYFGSNSLIANSLAASLGGSNPFFWMHVLCFAVLTVITWWRGYVTNSSWITVFPVIAGIFDLVPGFTFFALLPTLMHVLSLVIGVRQKAVDEKSLYTGLSTRLVFGTFAIAIGVFAVGGSFAVNGTARSGGMWNWLTEGALKSNNTLIARSSSPSRGEPITPSAPPSVPIIKSRPSSTAGLKTLDIRGNSAFRLLITARVSIGPPINDLIPVDISSVMITHNSNFSNSTLLNELDIGISGRKTDPGFNISSSYILASAYKIIINAATPYQLQGLPLHIELARDREDNQSWICMVGKVNDGSFVYAHAAELLAF